MDAIAIDGGEIAARGVMGVIAGHSEVVRVPCRQRTYGHRAAGTEKTRARDVPQLVIAQDVVERPVSRHKWDV